MILITVGLFLTLGIVLVLFCVYFLPDKIREGGALTVIDIKELIITEYELDERVESELAGEFDKIVADIRANKLSLYQGIGLVTSLLESHLVPLCTLKDFKRNQLSVVPKGEPRANAETQLNRIIYGITSKEIPYDAWMPLVKRMLVTDLDDVRSDDVSIPVVKMKDHFSQREIMEIVQLSAELSDQHKVEKDPSETMILEVLQGAVRRAMKIDSLYALSEIAKE